jgi:hypothetical protein
LVFRENKAYVRQVLASQVDLTAKDADFVPVADLPADHRYFAYNSIVNGAWSPTDSVIDSAKQSAAGEYRLETEGPHPTPGLRRDAERGDQSTEYARRAA